MQRLSSNHPECFRALTETKHDTGSVKVAARDSATRASDSLMDGTRDTIIKYVEVLRDCNSTRAQKDTAATRVIRQVTRAKEVTREIIKTAPCLTDTVTIHNKDGATLKLWQSGDQIKYSLTYPTVKYQPKETRWPWYVWLLIGFGSAIVLFFGLLLLVKTG